MTARKAGEDGKLELRVASDKLIKTIRKAFNDTQAHDHGSGEDIYCLNLQAWMGERMGLVLARLDLAERLAQAGPELLAACEGALDWIILGNGDCEPDPESPQENALRAAIKKARGT